MVKRQKRPRVCGDCGRSIAEHPEHHYFCCVCYGAGPLCNDCVDIAPSTLAHAIAGALIDAVDRFADDFEVDRVIEEARLATRRALKPSRPPRGIARWSALVCNTARALAAGRYDVPSELVWTTMWRVSNIRFKIDKTRTIAISGCSTCAQCGDLIDQFAPILCVCFFDREDKPRSMYVCHRDMHLLPCEADEAVAIALEKAP